MSSRLIVHHRPRGDHDLAFGLLDVRPGLLDHGLLVGLRVALLELVEDVEADSSIAAERVAAGLLEVLVQLGLQLLVDGDERRRAGRLVAALVLACRAHVCPGGRGFVGVCGGFAGGGLVLFGGGRVLVVGVVVVVVVGFVFEGRWICDLGCVDV